MEYGEWTVNPTKKKRKTSALAKELKDLVSKQEFLDINESIDDRRKARAKDKAYLETLDRIEGPDED